MCDLLQAGIAVLCVVGLIWGSWMMIQDDDADA